MGQVVDADIRALSTWFLALRGEEKEENEHLNVFNIKY